MRIALFLFLSTSMSMIWPVVAADKSLVVEIWPCNGPDESGNIGPEKFRMSPKPEPQAGRNHRAAQTDHGVTKSIITIYVDRRTRTLNSDTDLPGRRLLGPLLETKSWLG